MEKIIISHSHTDSDLAEAFTQFLKTAYKISSEEIRCTSLLDDVLYVTDDVHHSLKADLKDCKGIIALLSYQGLHNTYVKFELSAAWLHDKPILLIIGPRTAGYEKHLGPLKEFVKINIDDQNSAQSLFYSLKHFLSRTQTEANNLHDEFQLLESFVDKFKYRSNIKADFSNTKASIIFPISDTEVARDIKGKLSITDYPDTGYIYIAVVNKKLRLLWPKSYIERGTDAFSFFENGDWPPGELEIWLIGVGMYGKNEFDQWQIDGDTGKRPNYPPFKADNIPGMVRLDTVNNITWEKKGK